MIYIVYMMEKLIKDWMILIIYWVIDFMIKNKKKKKKKNFINAWKNLKIKLKNIKKNY